MPAPNSKKKVLKYSDREKLTAVRLSEAPGVRINDVAGAL
jgi:transposase-like protein